MKVALCLSGHFRTYSLCKESLFNNLINPYQPDIFIHTWDNLGFGRNGTRASTNAEKWIKNDSEIINQNKNIGLSILEFYRNSPPLADIFKDLNPCNIIIEKYEDVEEDIKKKAQQVKNKEHYDYPVNTISLWRKRYLCNKLKEKFESENNFKYDIVIVTRPDIRYNNIKLTTTDKIHTPLAHSYGVCSDIFAYSNSNNMDKYCNIFNNFEDYNSKNVSFNPHNLLKEHLNLQNLKFILDYNLNLDVEKDMTKL